jgi:hypothetical protein
MGLASANVVTITSTNCADLKNTLDDPLTAAQITAGTEFEVTLDAANALYECGLEIEVLYGYTLVVPFEVELELSETESPTASPSASPSATPSASPSITDGALGDAHLFGSHGDRTDFKGKNNTYYNMLSTNNMSANVLFVHDTYNWRNKIVFGSWMKGVAVSAMTSQNKLVRASYHCERPAIMDVHFEGETEPNGQVAKDSAFEFQGIKVSLSDKFVFALSNREWEVEAKNSFLPYQSMNAHKKRLDVNLKTLTNVDLNPVAPHGLIGQTYDRDDMMMVGALDDYSATKKDTNVIETSANAEGAIEGSAVDYEIDPLNPFSTAFKYSRFGLKRAAPRDASSLTGKKFPAMKASNAGAINDEVD